MSADLKGQYISRRAAFGLATGQFEEVIELIEHYPRNERWLRFYYHFKSKALVRSGQLDALEKLSKEDEAAETSSHRQE